MRHYIYPRCDQVADIWYNKAGNVVENVVCFKSFYMTRLSACEQLGYQRFRDLGKQFIHRCRKIKPGLSLSNCGFSEVHNVNMKASRIRKRMMFGKPNPNSQML